MQLIKYDAMCQAIAVCEKVDELKEMRDQAQALEAYAKQALNFDAERKAAKIRIRAERRCGQLLKAMKKGKGGGDVKSKNHSLERKGSEYKEEKQRAKISDNQAERFQALADVPDDKFEEELASPQGKPSTTSIIAANKPKTHELVVPNDALHLWDRMKDFERKSNGIMNFDIKALYDASTEPMQEDIKRLAPVLEKFFAHIKKVLK